MNDLSYVLQYFIACFSLYQSIHPFPSLTAVFAAERFFIVCVTVLKFAVHMFWYTAVFFILLRSMEAWFSVITRKFTYLYNSVPRTCHSSQNQRLHSDTRHGGDRR